MKRSTNYFFIMLLIALGSVTTTFAQTDSSDTDKSDGKEWKSDCKKHHKWHYDWDFSEDFMGLSKIKSPFISVLYGGSQLSIDDMDSDFNKHGFGEVKVGYQSLDKSYKDTDIIHFRSHYVDINAGNKNFYKSDEANKLTASTLQLGYGWNNGYGYTMGSSNIILTHSFGLGWTRLRFDDPVADGFDAKKLAYYDNSFRFGINSESGIQAQIIPHLSVNVAYNRSIVYPRVLFWKTAGSVLTEAAGYCLVDDFVGKVLKSTPAAAPIVNFLLKNGIAYGMYELRKEKMNFPFGGESPLMANTFKVGMTFSF
jgi:hypothetical protein